MIPIERIRREVDVSGNATIYITRDLSLDLHGNEIPFEVPDEMKRIVELYDERNKKLLKEKLKGE